MELNVSIYDGVKKVHAEQTEKMVFLKSCLAFLDDKKKLDEIEKVVDFFKDKILTHFEWEEHKVFPAALAVGNLELRKVVRQLQIEHIRMIGMFDVLADIVIHHGFHFQDETVRHQFKDAATEIIETMLRHAQEEDAHLYPVLRSQGVPLSK